MKNNTLADFFLPNQRNMVEDDKTKIKRLERELIDAGSNIKRLNMRCENLLSENFALKLQLNEVNQLQSNPPKPYPSFAEISAKSK